MPAFTATTPRSHSHRLRPESPTNQAACALNSGPPPPPTASARRIVVDESLSDAHVAAAVEATNGFSGREISKLAIAWQAAAYGSAEARFTPEIMASVLEVHVDQRERKRQWSNPKEAIVSP